MANSVAIGDQIRKKEAMETLVSEISRGENEMLPPSLRNALEVFDLALFVMFKFPNREEWASD
jgi:hypothetical protein